MADVRIVEANEETWELCPNCHDSRIIGHPVDINGMHANQEVTCTACGIGWYEVYRAAWKEVPDDETEDFE